jgi:hypothetical protein
MDDRNQELLETRRLVADETLEDATPSGNREIPGVVGDDA